MKTQNFNTDYKMGYDAELRAADWYATYRLSDLRDLYLHETRSEQTLGDFTLTYKDGSAETFDVKARRKNTYNPANNNYFKFEVWSNKDHRAGWGIKAPYDSILQVFSYNDYLLKINMHHLKDHFGIIPDMSFTDINSLVDGFIHTNSQLTLSQQVNTNEYGQIRNIGQTIDIPWSYLHHFVDGYYIHNGTDLHPTTYTDFITNGINA